MPGVTRQKGDNDMESRIKLFSRSIFCGLVLSMVLCFATAFGATIITVPSDGLIQEAIDAAEDGDTAW